MYSRKRCTSTHTILIPLVVMVMLLCTRADTQLVLSSCVELDNTFSNSVYYMKADISSSSSPSSFWNSICINVENAHNITLDGGGYRLRCDPQAYACAIGIAVTGSSNITVRNFVLTGFQTGIEFLFTSDASVINNEIYNNNTYYNNNTASQDFVGILIQDGNSHFEVRDNVIHHLSTQATNAYIYGINVYGTYHTITNNSIHHLQSTCCDICYIQSMAITSCFDCTVDYNTISDIHPKGCSSSSALNLWGMWIAQTTHSTVSYNTVQNFYMSGENIGIQGNEVMLGIHIEQADSITFEGNTLQNLQGGLAVNNSRAGRLSVGMQLEGTTNSVIYNSTITNIYGTTDAMGGTIGIQITDGVNITTQSVIVSDIFASDNSATALPAFSYYLNNAYDVSIFDGQFSGPTSPGTGICLTGGMEVDTSSGECNDFVLQNSTPPQVCRASAGDCDIEEYSMLNGKCPHDSLRSSSSVCKQYLRCDYVEYCTGDGVACPVADVIPMMCTCGNGFCDNEENCTTCYTDCFDPKTCNICGDKLCAGNENSDNCLVDCPKTISICTPACQNGNCTNGICVCYDQWSGVICSEKPVNISVATSESSPSINITIPSTPPKSIVLLISEIQEIRSSGDAELNSRYDSTNVFFDQTKTADVNGSQTWVYTANLNNSAVFTIKISFFENATSIDFANQTINIPPHTVKFNIRVDSWPFQTITNKLRVVLKTEGEFKMSADETVCAESDSEGDNIAWNRVLFGDYELYGRFHEFASLDGRARAIDFTMDSTNPGELQIVSPHFWDYVEIDPDYSVLLSNQDNKSPSSSNTMGNGCYAGSNTGDTQNKGKMKMLIIACTSATVACALVAGAVAFFMRTKKINHEKKKMRARIASMSSLNSSIALSESMNVDVST